MIERAAGIFRAAGDPARLTLLAKLCEGEVCVSELAAELDADMPAISQRLRILRQEGLVRRRREGQHIYYAVTDTHVADLVHTTLAHAAERPGDEDTDD